MIEHPLQGIRGNVQALGNGRESPP
jgi:hypothetical protein